MAKKKKKKSQALTMLVLFLVIIALVVVYFVAKNISKDLNQETVKKGNVKLVQVDTSKAKTLKYTIGGKEYTLIKEAGTWKLESEKERPLDQAKAQDMVDRFSEMVAEYEVFENQDNLAELGLNHPALTVNLTMEDGATYSYSTGEVLLTSAGGCNAIVSGYPGIYNLPEGYYTLFAGELNDLTQIPSITDVNSQKITKIKVINDSKVLVDLTKNVASKEWTIGKPYDPSVKIDSSNVSNLTSNYVTYKFLKNIEYNCTDFSKYGLKDPSSEVYVEYYTENADSGEKTEHSIKLSMGKTSEDGSIYYVRLNDSNSVYTMGSDVIYTLMNVDAFDYVDSSLFSMDISELSKASFVVNGKTYDLQIEKKATTGDASGDTYKLNGVLKEASAIGVLYGKVGLIEIEQEKQKDVDTQNPICSISVTDTKNKELKYSFYKYDNNYYAIEHEGQIYFLADKEKVNNAIKALEEL